MDVSGQLQSLAAVSPERFKKEAGGFYILS
jgi:hypothetical protein